MRWNEHRSQGRPWTWCATIVALSVLVGYWNAEDQRAAETTESHTTVTRTTDADEPSKIELIESTLAQAGCPGWMVLANEGESALQPPDDATPTNIQQTAFREAAEVPRVSYPKPIRVASRTLLQLPPTSNAKLTTNPSDDPDDLLDGVPDLLAGSTEDTEPAESTGDSSMDEPAADEQPPEPISEPEPQPAPKTPPEPAKQPVPLPQVTEDTPPQPVAEPVFPGPTAPAKPVEVAPATPPLSQPKLQLDPTQDTFLPPAPTKVQQQTPEVEQPEPIQTPAVKPTPHKTSPFAPPPSPSQQPTPHSTSPSSAKQGDAKTYCEFVAETNFPSAHVCAKCHEKIFDEWSISSHAYAAISPMFHKFEQTINDLSQGTVGYFCYRCHVPVGTTMGASRATPLWDLPQVAREGVTCVACHRVNQRYGKVNGHRRIEPGDIHAPVYGSIGGSGVAEVVSQKSHYKVKTSPHEQGPGQDIHVAGVHFDQLGKSEFCISCHQVAVHPGIKLEVVWEQYRASPACKKGVSCQDCHMGRIPGVASGYEYGAAAKIGDKVVNSNRKHANHVFYGPGYSIAHPGIFPHNKDALRWSMPEWLLFDWRAGWGTDEFERLVDSGRIHVNFPPVWAEADDRYDAREVLDDNLKKLQVKKISRQQTLENGSHVDGPFFDSQMVRGQDLKFHYIMTNTNEGHNLPSGSLGAQPQLWANVVLIGPRGQRVWESGYTDSYGDVADIHSVDVRNKRIPYDWQLFNLQTMFLITGAKGTDREFYLPVNFDFDQLPYLRPGAQPISVLNHPPFIRMEGRSLAPLGSRKIPYKVPAELMCESGRYRLSFRLRSRAEPIYFMRFCGSTKEMNRMMNEWMVDFHQSSIEFVVR